MISVTIETVNLYLSSNWIGIPPLLHHDHSPMFSPKFFPLSVILAATSAPVCNSSLSTNLHF